MITSIPSLHPERPILIKYVHQPSAWAPDLMIIQPIAQQVPPPTPTSSFISHGASLERVLQTDKGMASRRLFQPLVFVAGLGFIAAIQDCIIITLAYQLY